MNKKKLKILAMATAMLLLGNGAYLNAQVTVGANSVPQATLDVVLDASSTTLAGVIAPRVERQYLNANNYGSAQTGAIVYVELLNTSATGQTENVTTVGYYYFDGAKWQPFGSTPTKKVVVLKPEGIFVNGVNTAAFTGTYNVVGDEALIVTMYGLGAILNFASTPQATAGATIFVYNSNTATVANTIQNVEGLYSNAQYRGRTICWTGSKWVSIAA